MPDLTSLPTEVTTLLACKLDTDDFFSLRLSGSVLYSKTSNHFLARYFKTRRHMLNRHSLNNLLDVSAHPLFGSVLNTLEICVDHLTKEPPSYHPGTWDCPGDWELGGESGRDAIVNVEAYERCFEGQRSLGEYGLDTAYMTCALLKLANCKTVCITDTHRPWGAQSQKRQTGVLPTSNMRGVESDAHVKRTIQVVLTAIVASQISLDHLELSPGFNRFAIRPELLPLHQNIYLCQLAPKSTLVTYLFLTVDPENEENPDAWVKDLLSFLRLFPGLKQFGLHFHPRDEIGRLRSLSTTLHLDSLELLILADADCAEDDLTTLFLDHKNTLHEIHLDMVEILPGKGSWTSLERTVKEELSVDTFLHHEPEK